ncbi:MAG: PAS domain S-box protein [Rubrivivax sp.]|nr:PAS domain S-box protein [Rubrivivax sp.]
MADPARAEPRSAAAEPDPALLVDMAARVIVRFLGGMGLALLAVALVEAVIGDAGRLARPRLHFGLLLLAGAGAGAWLQGQGRPRAASAAALLGATLGMAVFAWDSGLGVHTLALAAVALVVALAGAAAGVRVAAALALSYVLVVLLLTWAELAGLLPGMAAQLQLPLRQRVVGHTLLALGGFLAAVVLQRVLGRALQAVTAERARLAELLRIGSDWTWELDARARLTHLSPSFESHTGRSVAEFMRTGEPGGPQLLENEDARLLREDLRARRAFRNRVTTYRCADGTQLTVRGTGEPMHDSAGRFIGWRGVSHDITAERAAQEQQRRSDDMLNRLAQMTPDPIFIVRLDGGAVLMANGGFLSFVQRTEAEVLGRNGVELGLWPDRTELRRLGEAIARDGTLREHRTVAHDAAGRPRDMLLSAAAFDWHGERVAVINARDVTEIDRTRREADAILDNASVGIALVREHRFERVNPVWEAIFGLPVGTLAGQPTRVMFPGPDDYDAFILQIGEGPERGGVVDIEHDFVRPDGGTVAVRLRARPVDTAHRRERGTIWVAEDITARRRAAQELALAKQQADAANDAKSAFLATMSHEIRTPLNGVLGLARLLQTPGLSESERQEYLGHVVEAAELLTGLVSDVLDLSKIEAGHLDIEHIEFELPGLVESTFRSFATLGRERGLEMRCQLDPALPRRVRGDPVRLRQILSNYLGNALKFTAQGGIGLTMSPLGAGTVRLAVTDSGVGVQPEVRERIFLPFAQADSSTTRRYGGTGLGLSICRELARRMGGEVGVDSDGVSGSTFWAELRLEPVALPADLASARASVSGLAGRRVLVAEDNPVNMLIVGAMLRRLGAEVLEAEDGEQAVQLAQRHAGQLHAVLMDLHMPGMDGLAATRRLRDDARTAALPVYALTAAVLEHDRQQAEAAGMDGFIGKPVLEAELLRVLAGAKPRA